MRALTPRLQRAEAAAPSARGNATRTVPTVAQALLALQQSVGNRAVSRLVATYAGGGSGQQVSLHGTTQGNYDGGVGKVSGVKVAPAKGCTCADGPCLKASAALQVRYTVEVTTEMPDVPTGLSTCQESRVTAFLRDVLGPHEREHARRIRTYNGVTTRTLSVKACGREEVMDAARAKADTMQQTEAEKRATDADALSLAIDPFNRKIDLKC